MSTKEKSIKILDKIKTCTEGTFIGIIIMFLISLPIILHLPMPYFVYSTLSNNFGTFFLSLISSGIILQSLNKSIEKKVFKKLNSKFKKTELEQNLNLESKSLNEINKLIENEIKNISIAETQLQTNKRTLETQIANKEQNKNLTENYQQTPLKQNESQNNFNRNFFEQLKTEIINNNTDSDDLEQTALAWQEYNDQTHQKVKKIRK